MRKIKISVLLITLLLALSACSPKEMVEHTPLQSTSEASPEQLKEEPPQGEHIALELMENVFVDAEIENPAKDAYEICKTVPNSYTPEYLADVFLEHDNSEFVVTPSDWDPNGFTLETESGSYIFCEDGRVFFNAPGYNVNKDIADIMFYYTQNEQSVNATELPFMSREDVLNVVSSLLSELNMLGQPEIRAFVAMRPDEITAYQQELMEDSDYAHFVEIGKTTLLDNLTELDNTYYLRLSFNHHDLPMFNAQFEQPVKFAGSALQSPSATAEMLLTSEGIQIFSDSGSFADNTSSGEVKPVLNVNDIFDLVKEKYDLQITTEPVTFTRIFMEYMPVQTTPSANAGAEVMLTPYWCLEYGYTRADGTIRMASAERFNAVTGKDYEYGG